MSELSPVHLLNVSGQPFGHSIVSAMDDINNPQTSLEKGIQELRANVVTLLESPSGEFYEKVASINRSFNTNDRDAYEKSVSDDQRFNNTTIVEWLAGASDKDLIAFAQWNVERNRSLNAQLKTDQEELTEATLEKVAHLIDLDFFPRNALRAVRRAASIYSPFKAMDSFESGAMFANGYFSTNAIHLADLYESGDDGYSISQELQETMLHELLHATGHTEGQGFLFHSAPASGRIWEEAFVSHSVSVAFTPERLGPQLDTYDPRERIGGTNLSYPNERRTVGHLSSPDIANIPPDLWGRAFFDRANQYQQEGLARKLRLGFQAITSNENGYDDFIEAYEDTWHQENFKARDALLRDIEDKVYQHRGFNVIDESFLDEVTTTNEDTAWMAFKIVDHS